MHKYLTIYNVNTLKHLVLLTAHHVRYPWGILCCMFVAWSGVTLDIQPQDVFHRLKAWRLYLVLMKKSGQPRGFRGEKIGATKVLLQPLSSFISTYHSLGVVTFMRPFLLWKGFEHFLPNTSDKSVECHGLHDLQADSSVKDTG